MSEFLGDYVRSNYCGETEEKQIGKTLTVMGWAAKRRDFGGLIFVDLRDRTGILQIVFDASAVPAEDFKKAESIRSEYVLAVKGVLRARSADTVNPKLATGTVELLAKELKILSDADTPPFAIDESSAAVNESVRLKYRYLDLRTAPLQEKLRMRSKICSAAPRVSRSARLHGDRDAVPRPLDAGGRPRLSRAQPRASRRVLRAAAVAAAV